MWLSFSKPAEKHRAARCCCCCWQLQTLWLWSGSLLITFLLRISSNIEERDFLTHLKFEGSEVFLLECKNTPQTYWANPKYTLNKCILFLE